MPIYQPNTVIAFHSCDEEVGRRVLNGKDDLKQSKNLWDWLGEGIYFWEYNLNRAWEYAIDSSLNIQVNKVRIEKPFILGAIIDLGSCLDLMDSEVLKILSEAYKQYVVFMNLSDSKLPVNKGKNRALDCAVFQYLHYSNKVNGIKDYDSVRCAFSEGTEVFPGTSITSQQHIQLCIRNPLMIKGFFLPRPIHV